MTHEALNENPAALKPKIMEALERRFVHYERFGEALAVALATKQNIWFHGPGGYGKSHMVTAVFEALGITGDTFFQTFGQGMTPERLVGSLDLKRLNEEGVFRYNTGESFMAKRFAVFEEMPAASTKVLLDLRDILQRRVYCNGAQRAEVLTDTIVVNANKSPLEVAEDGGAEADALVQRWALALLVEWPTHDVPDYSRLVRKQDPHVGGPTLGVHGDTLAAMMADVTQRGEVVTPRQAVQAMTTLKGAARLAGRSSVVKEDLAVLRFLPAFAVLSAEIDKQIAYTIQRAEAKQRMDAVGDEVRALLEAKPTVAQEAAALYKAAVLLKQRVHGVGVTDDLAPAKTKYLKDCDAVAARAVARIMEVA